MSNAGANKRRNRVVGLSRNLNVTKRQILAIRTNIRRSL